MTDVVEYPTNGDGGPNVLTSAELRLIGNVQEGLNWLLPNWPPEWPPYAGIPNTLIEGQVYHVKVRTVTIHHYSDGSETVNPLGGQDIYATLVHGTTVTVCGVATTDDDGWAWIRIPIPHLAIYDFNYYFKLDWNWPNYYWVDAVNWYDWQKSVSVQPIPQPTMSANYQDVVGRINAAKHWLDTLYQTNGTYGFMKEYAGFPLAIRLNNRTMRPLGDMYQRTNPTWCSWSKLNKLSVLPKSDSTKIGFDDGSTSLPDYDELMLTVWRQYHDDGTVSYTIRYDSSSGSTTIPLDLYFNDVMIWQNLRVNTPYTSSENPPTGNLAGSIVGSIEPFTSAKRYGGPGTDVYHPKGTMTFKTVEPFKGIPCSRYTVRHGARFGQYLYWIWLDMDKANSLTKLRYDHGFSYDIYDPIFGIGAPYSDGFMFNQQCYADTPTVWSQLPRGVNYYPYLSKVQAERSIYIAESHCDILLKCIQAIHILNKYGDPLHSYSVTGFYDLGDCPQVSGETSTPIKAANQGIAKLTPTWLGISQPSIGGTLNFPFGLMHGKEGLISGVRTATFSILMTLLGYKYKYAGTLDGGQTAKWYADFMFDLLTGTTAPQVGVYPVSKGYAYTVQNGLLWRPTWDGAFYNVWGRSDLTFPFVGSCGTDPSFTDTFNMDSEDEGPLLANIESTASILQALRVYAHYALGIDYPNGSYIP